MTDEEMEALPARKLVWEPQYVTVTQRHLEQILKLGWVTPEELKLWGRNRLAPAHQQSVDNLLGLLALSLTDAPIQ